MELKRPGGKTSIVQDRQIEFIRRLGFTVYVIDSVEDIEEFIKKIGSENKRD